MTNTELTTARAAALATATQVVALGLGGEVAETARDLLDTHHLDVVPAGALAIATLTASYAELADMFGAAVRAAEGTAADTVCLDPYCRRVVGHVEDCRRRSILASIEAIRTFAVAHSEAEFSHLCTAALAGEQWAAERVDSVLRQIAVRNAAEQWREGEDQRLAVIRATDTTRPDGLVSRTLEAV